MRRQTRTYREFQVRDEIGCLDQYPATVQGLKDALAAYQDACDAFTGDSDNDDETPRIELLQQTQYRYGDEDWEQDWCEHYQLDERMPTKSLQSMVDRHNK